MSLTLKVTSLFVRTLAKPVANAIKRNAHEHERFRRVCVKFAQGLHRVDMRMRLGLLQDPAVIDRQIKKEVAMAEARRKEAAAPTVLTEEQTKAEEALTEKEREAIKKKAEERARPRIRPLSEQKAIEMGANFVAETFIFAVGIAVILVEQWRQRRKAKNARDDIREDLEAVQAELKAVKAELEEFKAKHPEPVPSKLLSFWKGHTESKGHSEEKNVDPTKSATTKPESTKSESMEPVPAADATAQAESPVTEQRSAEKTSGFITPPPSKYLRSSTRHIKFIAKATSAGSREVHAHPQHSPRRENLTLPQAHGAANHHPGTYAFTTSKNHNNSTYAHPSHMSLHTPSLPTETTVSTLLPYCTTEPPLSTTQVIALSDIVGSLRELVLLALAAAAGDAESMGRLEGALGRQGAVAVVEFFEGEWEIEG
ncbi:hypothetical protein yc1106_04512 [Curvularia clavata]|uniref:OPA3-like protein n=1 Tax=Curvularia clavata TaxID=95742 RepID=A0A9Q8ZBE7_CURCL|nr:hypothetical protein yc1106_04512 [Curvularia clavata]